MNKKISILILSLILISSLAFVAKANSFSDVLNTFTNQLYWLRDNLKAQVNSGTSKPQLTSAMTSCSVNSDCVLTETECCPCAMGGDVSSIKAINKNYLTNFNTQLNNYCFVDNHFACIALYNCDNQKMPTGAICENKVCKVTTGSTVTPYLPPVPPVTVTTLPTTTTTIKYMTKEQASIAQTKINDECAKVSKAEIQAYNYADFSKTTAIANLINGYSGESLQIDCVLTPSISKALGSYKGSSLHVWVSYTPLQSSSAIELSKFGGSTLTVKTNYPVADSALSTLANFKGKTLNIGIMNTASSINSTFTLNGPVGVALGNFKGDQLTIDKIDIMALNAVKGLANFAGKFLSINTKSNSNIEYFSDAKVNHLELKGFKEITVNQAKGLAKFKGQILWLPSITTITKSVAEELVKFTGHTLSLDSITTTDSSVLETLGKFKGTVMVLTSSIYNSIRDYQISLGNAVLPPTTTTSTIPTESWYKLTTFLGCKMDEWTKTCIDTNVATSSGNPYKFCINQYLLSKKITFTDLTVPINKPVDGAVTCMACGCEMPEIYLKAKTSFDDALKLIGFTKSNDPSKAEEQAVDPNKIKIDLSTQGFFFKENKENNKINYKVLTKNSNSSCGDGRCDLLEQYLYELDFSKHCSPLVDKVVNFYHCPLDCKMPLDVNSAISQDEFNKLQFECSNNTQKQVETVNTVIPQPIKPIAEMNQVEKNSYIMQLQQVLISLLTQLLNMLKK